MRRYMINTPDRETVITLLEKLEDCVGEMEELREDLSDGVEEYMDETEDLFAQAGSFLEDASQEHKLNLMLMRELNACRKELLALFNLLSDHGLQPPKKGPVYFKRLNCSLYEQDPESPFYIQDPDRRFNSLVSTQWTELIQFEAVTPMTTAEREALRDYVISRMGFDPDPEAEWIRKLNSLRNGSDTTVQEGQ